MENKTFIDIRQNISTAKNNSYSIISPYYDPNMQVITKYNNKAVLGDLHSDNYLLHNPDSAKRKLFFHNILSYIFIVLISVIGELIRSAVTFKFIGFQPNFIKYILFELSIILLYITFCNSFVKDICFKKYNFDERRSLLSLLISSNQFKYVSNEIAINDVCQIINFSLNHYFGENKYIGRDYLIHLKETVRQKLNASWNYDAFNDYEKSLGKVEGKNSIIVAIISLLFGIAIQIIQIISIWQDVAEFKVNILVTSILLPFVIFYLFYSISNRRYKKIWYELEADYLIFNYQNKKLPFSESTPIIKIVTPTPINDDVYKEIVINKMVELFNKNLILELVTFRSFKFVDDYTLVVFGIKESSINKTIPDLNLSFNKILSDCFR